MSYTLDEITQAAIAKAVSEAVAKAKLEAHPVGSIYCSVDSASPADLFGGTWEEISSGRVLQGADSNHAAGTTADAGLPNITGKISGMDVWGYGDVAIRGASGCFYNGSSTVGREVSISSGSHTQADPRAFWIDASRSSSVYGKSSTVQPPAYFV
jgi:hypothetical protein